MTTSEAEIISLIKSEETKNYGFNLLTRLYQERLYWVIRRVLISHDDTDDVVQEVFIKVWKSIDSFEGNSQLYTWMYRIAVNEALSALRKKKRRFFLPIVDLEQQLSQELDQGVGFDGDEIELKLQKAILKLPEKQRMVFNLKYFDEMKYKDMAVVLELSEGALKAQYHHAVKKIKEYIERD